MKLYDLLVDGYHTPLTDVQIAELFDAGRLRRNDPCKETGKKEFRTLDELFPLLKYASSASAVEAGQRRFKRVGSILEHSDCVGDEVRPLTSSLKAGWICFGIGLLLSWVFPLGNAFFSIAIITAIVAMCTHQVNRGLVLLVSSFFGIALSVAVFLTLVAGAIHAAAAPAFKQANAEMKQIEKAQANALAQVSASNQQWRTLTSRIPSSNPAANPFVIQSSVSTASRQVPAIPPTNQAAIDEEQGKAKTREAIRQAEQQRDRTIAKEKEIEQLQQSLDWYDEQIRNVRAYGGNDRSLVEQRDQLQKKKWELQAR